MTSSPSSSLPTRPAARRFSGRVVALGLMALILAVASGAWIIHKQNIWARSQARQDAEAAEEAERDARERATDQGVPTPGE